MGESRRFLPFPAGPVYACVKQATRVNSLSLVRFDGNDYSAPVRYGHHKVLVKGYVDRVLVCCDDKIIATHERVWDKERTVFDPMHYLALLDRKPGALDHGIPFVELRLPECFSVLRRRLEAELDGEGTREYIAVLRLLEKYPLSRLTLAVEKGLRANAVSRDVIALYLYPDERPETLTFRLEGRDHLRGVSIAKPDLGAYSAVMLVGGR